LAQEAAQALPLGIEEADAAPGRRHWLAHCRHDGLDALGQGPLAQGGFGEQAIQETGQTWPGSSACRQGRRPGRALRRDVVAARIIGIAGSWSHWTGEYEAPHRPVQSG